MRRLVIFLAFVGLMNCKENTKRIKNEAVPVKSVGDVAKNKYPEAFKKILAAHGGLENWKGKRTLTFEIVKPNAREKHTVDLLDNRD